MYKAQITGFCCGFLQPKTKGNEKEFILYRHSYNLVWL